MNEKNLTSSKRVFRTFLALLFAVSSVNPGPVVAQSDQFDIEGPTIEHEVLESGDLGKAQEFSATVMDNEQVESVLFLYRFNAEDEFAELEMKHVADSTVYTASIETDGIKSTQIVYYIQAEDSAGNIVLEGYGFNPLRRVLKTDGFITSADTRAAATEPAESPAQPPKQKSNMLYYVLGALAVAGIAAAAGGGGGGGSSASECCIVDLTLRPPLP